MSVNIVEKGIVKKIFGMWKHLDPPGRQVQRNRFPKLLTDY